MKFTNLEKAIEELNAPYVWEDGETDPSMFKFCYNVHKNYITIYDENEYYNIDYLENSNCLAYECSLEFGYKFEPETEDKVHEKLERAIKKDLGKDKYLEWEDSVVMSVYF